jgi:general secretion pathway protein G
MKKQKRPITLLEIMIVIFLIGLIGSVIGYNMKGSLDEGRAFKTETAATRIREILLLEVAKGASLDDVIARPDHYLAKAGTVSKPEKMLKDGWDQPFEFSIDPEDANDITITSQKLIAHQAAKEKSDKKKKK